MRTVSASGVSSVADSDANGLSPVDFKHGLISDYNLLLQRVSDPEAPQTVDRTLHLVAAFHDGPFLLQEKLRTLHRRQPRQAVIDHEPFAQRQAHFAEHAGQRIGRRDDSGSPHVTRLEVCRRLADALAARGVVDARLLPHGPIGWLPM